MTKERPVYTAKCERSGRWWAVSVPEVRGVFTQARRLDQVEGMVREAVALIADVDPESFDVVVEPALPRAAAAAVERMAVSRRRAADATSAATDASATAAKALLEAGLSMREAGLVLNLSHQRVAQLASRATTERDARSGARGAAAGHA